MGNVLDILLIDLLGEVDVSAVRAAVEKVFVRATHDFPPAIRFPSVWQPEFEVLAKELGYPAISAVEIET